MLTVGLDTNVLLDYFLDRPAIHATERLFDAASRGTVEFLIALPVVLEGEWTLRRFYQKSKIELLLFFTLVLDLPWANRTDWQLIDGAMRLYRAERSVSFDDCVIVLLALAADVDGFVTGDKKLARLHQRLSKKRR